MILRSNNAMQCMLILIEILDRQVNIALILSQKKSQPVKSHIRVPYPNGVCDVKKCSIVRVQSPMFGLQRFVFPFQSLSMKIEDELRKSKSDPREPESEVARRAAERRLFGSVGIQSDRIRQEMQRYASMRDPVLRLIL